MDALDLVLRFALFAVFAVAAVAKLRDQAGTREAVVAFGVPGSLAGPVAVLLPGVELATAALLVPPATAVAGAVLAAGLLGTFTVAIAANLARGHRPACRCFGQLSAKPVGARTLLRNGALLFLAAGLVAIELMRPSADPIGWIGDAGAGAAWIAAGAIAVVAVAGAAAVALAVLRAYGRLLRRIDELERRLGEAAYDDEYEAPEPEIGLAPGAAAPLDGAADIEGRPLLPPEPLLLALLFTSPSCGPCRELLPDVARWQRSYADRLSFAVAVAGTADESLAEARRYGLDRVAVDEGSALADAFEAYGTPSAVLVDHRGEIASWVAPGAPAIRRLVQASGRPKPVSVGEPAPTIELETLEGAPFTLTSLRGKEAAIVFWSPTCGFCRQMHEELRDYAATVDGEGSAVLIASSGSGEEIRAEGFPGPVVVDDDRQLADAFGASGTPMAVRLAADGTVASSLAPGPAAVFDLLGRPGLEVTQVAGREVARNGQGSD